MRTKNSIKNIYINILTQIVIILLGFLSRKVFVDNLGTEYLGINGLLTNVLSILSLVEGGIGTSIVYNLYKPLADDNRPRVIALVQLYKKIYLYLAILTFILSIGMYPLLNIIIKNESSIPYMGLVYFIFVLKNIISYLNAHKWSLINADQKGYILAKYNLIFNIIITISKIIILQVTKNYVLFLAIEILIYIVQNMYNGRIVNERYPYIKTKKKYKVDEEVKDNLITNVKALFLHNIGSYFVLGTDNLLISAFISVKSVGLYSNYTMITGQMSSLINSVLGGIGASVGNLIATENKGKVYEVFKTIYLINFWIYSISVIFLYNLLEPFINWWLGEGLLLDKFTFIIVLMNFYLMGMRNSILTFKTKAGIFTNDKYVPLIESAINLGASFILVKYFGLAGIFLGTTISTICVPLWTQAKLVYNKIFYKSIFEYFKKYIIYIVITIIVGYLTSFICTNFIVRENFMSLLIRGIISVIIPNIIYIAIFYRTKEFKHILKIISPMLCKLKIKVQMNY